METLRAELEAKNQKIKELEELIKKTQYEFEMECKNGEATFGKGAALGPRSEMNLMDQSDGIEAAEAKFQSQPSVQPKSSFEHEQRGASSIEPQSNTVALKQPLYGNIKECYEQTINQSSQG